MTFVHSALDWVSEHWGDLLAIYAGLVLLARAVASMTENPSDDQWVSRFDVIAQKLLNLLALRLGKPLPRPGPNPGSLPTRSRAGG
jgi:hypothetical protein